MSPQKQNRARQELKRKGMTKQLLFEECTAQYPNRCYSYSPYGERYRQWQKKQKRSMRPATAVPRRPRVVKR